MLRRGVRLQRLCSFWVLRYSVSLGSDTPSPCRFYAFQFQLEELIDSLEELQAAVTTLVRVTPRHARAAREAEGPYSRATSSRA